MNLAAPRKPREFFQSFALFDHERGVESILDSFDFTGVSPHQVYGAVLGRIPESADVAIPRGVYSPRKHFDTAMHSPEFRAEVVGLLLASFPGHRRKLFVHIPKCAGTSVAAAMAARDPALPLIMTDPAWVDHAAMCRLIRTFVLEAAVSRSVFVHGHVTLRHFLDRKFYRFGDRIFTVVRDPVDILVSQANYIATILRDDAAATRPDTREWRALLGLDWAPGQIEEAAYRDLARQILLDPRLVSSNPLCTFLGEGTFASALEVLALCQCEITDMKRVPAWLRQEWHVSAMPRENTSEPFLRRETLNAHELQYLLEMTSEDRVLYAELAKLLDAADALAIDGTELVRRHLGTSDCAMARDDVRTPLP